MYVKRFAIAICALSLLFVNGCFKRDLNPCSNPSLCRNNLSCHQQYFRMELIRQLHSTLPKEVQLKTEIPSINKHIIYTENDLRVSIKLLIDKGVDVEVANKKGFTPLMLALKYKRDDWIVSMLIHAGATQMSVRSKDPVLMAIRNGNIAQLKYYLKEDPQCIDKVNKAYPHESICMLAARSGNLEMLKLIDHYVISHAYASISFINGFSVLSAAVLSNNPECVQFVIEKGESFYHVDVSSPIGLNAFATALYLTNEQFDIEVVNIIFEQYEKRFELYMKYHMFTKTNKLFCKVDAFWTGESVQEALMWQTLIFYAAAPQYNELGERVYSQARHNTIRRLINLKINPNHKDRDGKTYKDYP